MGSSRLKCSAPDVTSFNVALRHQATMTFAERPVFGVNLTLRSDIGSLANTPLQSGELLGWLDHNRLDHFKTINAIEGHPLEEFFSAQNTELRVNIPLILSDIAQNSDEAHQVCLFRVQAEVK